MPTGLYALIELRPDHPNLGKPFYIGIGTTRRPRTHFAHARSDKGHPNAALQAVFEAHFRAGIEPAVVILGTFETLDEAFEAEKRTIRQHGRIGVDLNGILCNISGGGQGFESVDMAASWADPTVRGNRVRGMLGVKKTTTPESTAARRKNANAPKSAEALALMKAASDRNWADPDFRTKRSADMSALWEDPERRARFVEGRSEGIAESWADPEVRAKRTAGVSAAVKNKWANDPDYAERSRAALKASWDDPVKKAERVAKMLASRAGNGRTLTPEGRAKQAEVMRLVNASKTTEERSAVQAASWSDPNVAAARKAGLKKAAQNPALKAARLAAMLEGKRRKARAAEAVQSEDRG